MTAEPFDVFLVVWNQMQNQGTPSHHVRIARWLDGAWQRRDTRLLLMAFRGSGKSTLVGLFAAWLLARDPCLRLLVLAAEGGLATKMVRSTRRVVESHPLAARLKPKRSEEWASDRFTVRRPLALRDPSMLARGIDANITGSRADLVICDDVEVPLTAGTTEAREGMRDKLAEIDYVLVPGGTQLYVGTPHSLDTIYRTTGKNAFLSGFKAMRLPLVDGEGRSAWPERFGPAAIAELRLRSGPARFASQMQLEARAIAEARLDPDRLAVYDAEPVLTEAQGEARLHLDGVRLVNAVAWWDPAFGDAKGDGSVLAALFDDGAGRHYLHRLVWLNRAGPAAPEEDEALRQVNAVADLLDDLRLPALAVEINGIGRFLPGLLRRVLRERGLPIAVIEVASHQPKDQRILEGLDARLAARAISVHREVANGPLVAEMREWRPGAGRNRDDGLDALAGALSLAPVRVGSRFGAGATLVERPRWQGAAQYRARQS